MTLTQRNSEKHRAIQEAGIWLVYAGSATMSNGQKHNASDYESEGRRFESSQMLTKLSLYLRPLYITRGRVHSHSLEANLRYSIAKSDVEPNWDRL